MRLFVRSGRVSSGVLYGNRMYGLVYNYGSGFEGLGLQTFSASEL